ncbi:hypothetical protein OKW34_004079 [Paraburkholderia youngii]
MCAGFQLAELVASRCAALLDETAPYHGNLASLLGEFRSRTTEWLMPRALRTAKAIENNG